MLLTSLPDMDSSSAEFRAGFHAKWGRENTIVLGRAARTQFGPCAHTLSIRAAIEPLQRLGWLLGSQQELAV